MSLLKPSRQTIAAAILVMVVTFLMFSPSLNHDFLHYDDEIYVYENPYITSLGVDNIIWIFTHSFYKSYTPLVLVSHAVDYALWGLDPRGHHLTSVLLHAFNAGWVFLLSLTVLSIFKSKTQPQVISPKQNVQPLIIAAFSALVFSLHPLRVESVAWVSDRKDLLMGFFALPAILSYLKFASDRNSPSAPKWLWMTFLLQGFAILSKNVAVVLPVVFLAMDFLLLGRPGWRKELPAAIKEKWPLFLLSIVVGASSFSAGGGGKSHYAVEYLESGGRLLLPFYSIAFYLLKLVWPLNLSPIYVAPSMTTLAVYSGVTVAVIGLCILLGRKGIMFPLFCLSLFVLLLLPTFAGLSAGIQPWADRYSYLPSVGFGLFVAGLLDWMLRNKKAQAALATGLSFVLLTVCAILSFRQIPAWKDSLSLWRYAVIATSSPTPLTLGPLGVALYHAGELDSALVYYRKSIEIEPKYVDSHYNIGVTLEAKGMPDSAIASYLQVCALDSDYVSARSNLGNLYLRKNMTGQAIAQYNAILRLHPENASAYYNLGVALESKGETEEAVKMYTTAIRYQPGYAAAFINLGSAKLKLGKPDEALALFDRALKYGNKNPVLNFNLGVAYEAVKDTFRAIQSYTQAIQFRREYLDAYVNLGNMYARLGMLENAVAVYEQAVNVGLDSADVLFNFGVVLEALGDGKRAMESYKQAIQKKETYLDPYINCANLYARIGNLDSAAAVYERALQAGLDSPDVHRNLAIIQKEMGKRD